MRREGGRIIHANLQLWIILNLSYLFWNMDFYRCWLCCFGTGSDRFHLSSHACTHTHPPLFLMVPCCKSKYEQMQEGHKRKRKVATWGQCLGQGKNGETAYRGERGRYQGQLRRQCLCQWVCTSIPYISNAIWGQVLQMKQVCRMAWELRQAQFHVFCREILQEK